MTWRTNVTSRISSQASLDDVLLAFNLASGNLMPVDKLLTKEELYGVLNEYSFRGETYALPYFLFSNVKHQAGSVVEYHYADQHAFTVTVDHCYEIDKPEVVALIFGTTDDSHPGVKKLLDAPQYVVAGNVTYFNEASVAVPYCRTASVGDVVFQSRNPPHKAHEAIVAKHAPSMTYSTPYSTAKKSDYPFAAKIATYEKVADIYGIDIYVTTLPRVFAGPREALQNCLLFQNKGAKRFVMGRGKNCVGDFYSETASFEACKQFFDAGRISIEPIWQDTIEADGVELKGSSIKKDFIDAGLMPPDNLMSDYIATILLERKWAS